MEGASRTRLVALAVLLALSVPLVIVALGGGRSGGDSEQPAVLRVERSPGLPEIVLYIEDRSLNEPSTAGGAATVVVECMDDGGEVVSSNPESWPFADTDQGTLDPHAHVAMSQELVDRIARCRLKGTDPPLEGRLL